MHSIPQALLWELTHRGRWKLIAFAITANAIPLMLLSALQSDGAIDPLDSSSVIMHSIFVQLNVLIFGIGIYDAQGLPSRLYAMPIRTASLVSWQLLTGMAAIGLQFAASTIMLNSLFDINWPLWGPLIFAMTSFAAMQVVLWTTEKSAWLPIAMIGVGAALGLWFKSRTGPIRLIPQHLWSELTVPEVLTMLTMMGISYAAAVIGLSRLRCGEPLPSLGIVAWFERVLEIREDTIHSFATPLKAHCRMEWRRKGWLFPGVVIFGISGGIIIWLLFIRDLSALLHGFAAGGWILCALGIAGFALGTLSSDESSLEIGNFAATRPMTNTQIAQTALRILAHSVLLTWTIWLIPFAMIYITLAAQGSVPVLDVAKHAGPWFLPLTLVGFWTVASVFATATMTGRSNTIAYGVCLLTVAGIGIEAFAKFAVPAESRIAFQQSVAIVIAAVVFMATAGAFLLARQRRLIETRTVVISTALWILMCGFILIDGWLRNPSRPFTITAFLLLGSSLVVTSLAAAPLAVAWNRNR